MEDVLRDKENHQYKERCETKESCVQYFVRPGTDIKHGPMLEMDNYSIFEFNMIDFKATGQARKI
jgi:hypothetical protein